MLKNDILKVFVYGTLKVGGESAYSFNDHRISVKKGKIKGTMLNIAGMYPGVILRGNDIIHGEVHEYRNGKVVEYFLDIAEGHKGKDDKCNLYNKETVDVIVQNSPSYLTRYRAEKCLIYTYAQRIYVHEKIGSGKW